MKQWDKIYKKKGMVSAKPYEDMGKTIRIFKKKKVKRVLDLGCGTGRHVVLLARHGFLVHGFDISETGIRLTKEWLKEEKLRAGFKIGSMYKKLPYSDNYFDAIISTNAIHHATIENIRKAIKEVERILKPNGLIFMTFRKRKFRKSYPQGTIIEKYGKQKVNYRITGKRTYVPIDGREKGLIHYLFNKAGIRKEFRNFKFYNIWVDSERRHYCFLGELKK